MEWERKFSSIVQETESNLAKVKQRLGSAHASSVTALSLNGYSDLLPDRSGIGTNSLFAKSFPPPGTYNGALSSSMMTSTPNKFLAQNSSPYNMSTSIGTKHNYPGDGILPLDQSPGVLALLSDRLEAQTRAMEQLTRTVRQLEEEKSQYQTHVRDLRNELTTLTGRMTEKGVDIGTERKIESWKRDIMAEIQLMQSQIQLHRTDDLGTMPTANILRELNETKRHVTDECDSIRREVDSLKSRLVKLEVDVSNVITDNRDIGRRHDRLDKKLYRQMRQSMRDLVESHNTTARDVTRTMGDRNEDKAEINELKSSLRSLHEKLDEVQDHVLQDIDRIKHRPPKPSYKKSKHPKATVMSPATTDVDDVTDSTDMLDLHSSDLSLSPTHKTPLKAMGTLSEDDLDLDLTTDDLISSYSCLDTEDLK